MRLYSPAHDGKHIKCFPLRAELATNFMPSGPPGSWGNLFGPGIQKSQCSKMAMLIDAQERGHVVGTCPLAVLKLALVDEVAG